MLQGFAPGGYGYFFRSPSPRSMRFTIPFNTFIRANLLSFASTGTRRACSVDVRSIMSAAATW